MCALQAESRLPSPTRWRTGRARPSAPRRRRRRRCCCCRLLLPRSIHCRTLRHALPWADGPAPYAAGGPAAAGRPTPSRADRCARQQPRSTRPPARRGRSGTAAAQGTRLGVSGQAAARSLAPRWHRAGTASASTGVRAAHRPRLPQPAPWTRARGAGWARARRQRQARRRRLPSAVRARSPRPQARRRWPWPRKAGRGQPPPQRAAVSLPPPLLLPVRAAREGACPGARPQKC